MALYGILLTLYWHFIGTPLSRLAPLEHTTHLHHVSRILQRCSLWRLLLCQALLPEKAIDKEGGEPEGGAGEGIGCHANRVPVAERKSTQQTIFINGKGDSLGDK